MSLHRTAITFPVRPPPGSSSRLRSAATVCPALTTSHAELCGRSGRGRGCRTSAQPSPTKRTRGTGRGTWRRRSGTPGRARTAQRRLLSALVFVEMRRFRARPFCRSDPYGCSEELSTKRNHRDPFARGVPYHARCSALRPLLNHCGPSIFLGKLPWNEDGGDAGGGAAPGGAEEAEGHALGRRGGGGVRSLATEAETQEEEG